MSGVATLFHSDLIKATCVLESIVLIFFQSPFEMNAAGLKLALYGMWRRFVADEGLSGTWWPLPPCHMCKRFIKPRSGVRRLGFCFLFHTDRGFIWVQISAPPSKAWQWQPFKHGLVLKPLQARHRASLRVLLWLWRDVYVSTLPPRIILWQHLIELQWLLVICHNRFGWLSLPPMQSISANAEFDSQRVC